MQLARDWEVSGCLPWQLTEAKGSQHGHDLKDRGRLDEFSGRAVALPDCDHSGIQGKSGVERGFVMRSDARRGTQA